MTLRELRAAAGLSLRDVSALTGISKSMLSKAERGEARLGPVNVARVARALGLSVLEVLAANDETSNGGRAA